MTTNPPPLRTGILRHTDTGTAPVPARDRRGDLEKLFIPDWLNHDPAADGPNYLGYTMLLLPTFLLAMLGIFAVALL